MKYITKPIEVEAVQFFPDTKFPMNFGLDYMNNDDRSISVTTIEGSKRCDFGDWVIKLKDKEFIVRSRYAFAEGFEEKSK